MQQGRPLYRRVAGVDPNNLEGTELESTQWFWRNPPSSKIPPGPNQGSATPCVLPAYGSALFPCVADAEANNAEETELESALWL